MILQQGPTGRQSATLDKRHVLLATTMEVNEGPTLNADRQDSTSVVNTSCFLEMVLDVLQEFCPSC
jgi:hypothetical protein